MIDLKSFYLNNSGFDLLTADLHNSQTVKRLNLPKDKKEEEDTLLHLKALQRLHRVAPAESHEALIKHDFKSAHKITSVSQASFVSQIGGELGADGAQKAAQIYAAAEQRTNQVRHVWAQVNHLAAPHFQAMRANAVQPSVNEYFQGMQGYQDIFGSLNYCDCSECKSIFGPAAYFVDLLRIIDKYVTQANVNKDGQSTIPSFMSFGERRPDLKDIPLTCESTNQTIPYINIVNQRLEHALSALGAGNALYQSVAKAVFPFNLPFHLPLTKMRACLARFDTSFSDILRLLGASNDKVAQELIAVSSEEWALITTSNADPEKLKASYGVTDLSALNTLDTFCKQTGLTVLQAQELFTQNLSDKELAAQLNLKFFINQGQTTAPSVTNGQIQNLNPAVLDRIHRFIRLANKLGWSFADLDWAIHAVSKTDDLDAAALTAIAGIQELSQRYKLKVSDALAFVADLKTWGKGKDAPVSEAPFDQVFNRTVGQPVYHPAYDGNKLYTGDSPTWDSTQTDAENQRLSTWVAAGVGLREADLKTFVKKQFNGKLDLTVENLSTVYRHARLSRLLQLTMEEYLLFLKLFAPQNPIFLKLRRPNDKTVYTVEELGTILETREVLKRSRLNVYQLNYFVSKKESSPFVKGANTVDQQGNWLKSLDPLSGTVTIAKNPLNGDTVTIAGLVFTFTEAEGDKRTVKIGESPAATATALYNLLTKENAENYTYADDHAGTITVTANRTIGTMSLSTTAATGTITFSQKGDQYRKRKLLTLLSSLLGTHEETIEAILSIFRLDLGTEDLTNDFLERLSIFLVIVNTLKLTVKDLAGIAKQPQNYFAAEPPWPNAQELLELFLLKEAQHLLGDDAGELTGYMDTSDNADSADKLASFLPLEKDELKKLLDGMSDKNKIKALRQVMKIAEVAHSIGAGIPFLKSLTTLKNWDDYTAAADNLLALVQARHSADDWPQLQTQLEGEVQARLRTALVALALTELPKNPATDWIKTDRNLYEYLLIDVQMSGCSQISKIKEGLNAAQLYLHRCRERLEPVEHLNIPEEWWEWLVNYRIWEANRKIFLYPENYLDPSIRQSKTTLFKDFENSLKQGNLDQETVEKAFRQYLDGFAELAQLEYVDAYYHDVAEEKPAGEEKPAQESCPQADGASTSIFFFARTKTEPYRYHYIIRRPGKDEQTGIWSEWKEVGVSINATHVTPVFAFDRLFLFWVERKIQKDSADDGSNKPEGGSNKKVLVEKATIKYSFYNFNKDWIQPQTLAPETVISVSNVPKSEPVSGAPKGTFMDLFKPDFFDTTRLAWNKVYCLKVPPTAYSESTGNQAEKLVVMFGPMLDTSEGGALSSDQLKPPLDTNEYRKELNGWLYRAAQNFQLVKSKGLAGSLPAFAPIVLESDLHANFLVSPKETVFLANSALGIRVGKDELTGQPGLALTSRIICDNYYSAQPSFGTVYSSKDGIGQYDLKFPMDRAISFDCLGTGNMDHLVLYRPGYGYLLLVRKDTNTGHFVPLDTGPKGTLLDFDLMNPVDRVLAFDLTGSSRPDHLVVYRPSIKGNSYLYIYKAPEPGKQFVQPVVALGPTEIDSGAFGGHQLGEGDHLLAFEWATPGKLEYLVVYNQKGAGEIVVVKPGATANEPSNVWNSVASDPLVGKLLSGPPIFAFDFESSGMLNNLVSNGPQGLSIARFVHSRNSINPKLTEVWSVEKNRSISIFGDKAHGLAFDYNSSGKLDHLVMYLPGSGKIRIIKPYGQSELDLVYTSDKGIGDFDLSKPEDRIIAFDGDSSGKQDHLVLYRPGTGMIAIVRPRRLLSRGGRPKTARAIANHPAALICQGDKEAFLLLDSLPAPKSLTGLVKVQHEKDSNVTSLALGALDRSRVLSTYKLNATRLSTASVHQLSSALFAGGIDRLLSLSSQQPPSKPQLPFKRFEFTDGLVVPPMKEDGAEVDFDGAYGLYYWELFFHAPSLVFSVLNGNQTYDQAEKWLKYIFNPTAPAASEDKIGEESFITSTLSKENSKEIFSILKEKKLVTDDGNVQDIVRRDTDLSKYFTTPSYTADQIASILDVLLLSKVSRFWKFLPFRTHPLGKLKDQLSNSSAIDAYHCHPFDPHAIARLRIGAYEKASVMKYIDNLLNWGDKLFRQYTWESITTATMYYMYAWNLLGPRPQNVGDCATAPPKSYAEIAKAYKDQIPEFLVQLETVLGHNTPPLPTIPYNELDTYFCVPENADFVAYWDRVEDRIFKIRHCLNIDGQSVPLALFEPPIDPMALARAAAAGADVLAAFSGGGDIDNYYRFHVLLDRARAFTDSVMQFGAALLSALEKKDAAALDRLRSTQEKAILNLSTRNFERQIEEQDNRVAALEQQLEIAQDRQKRYERLIAGGRSGWDSNALANLGVEEALIALAIVLYEVTGGVSLIPTIFGLADGGNKPHKEPESAAKVLELELEGLKLSAEISKHRAEEERRVEEWEFEASEAAEQAEQLEKEIAAAEKRHEILKRELEIHQQAIAHAEEYESFLKARFTNQDLYQWMIGRVSTVYNQAYHLALDLALKAQSAYRFELSRDDSFIQFDYWDSSHKGLLAGEGLMLALHQMEAAYLQNNKPVNQLEKEISLKELHPVNFVDFRDGAKKGELKFSLSQDLFDGDFPGHYDRKIKSVSLTFVCEGLNGNAINATLTQTSNTVFKSDGTTPLRTNWLNGQSVALSRKQNDAGLFVLDFRFPDDQFYPFEGTGAVSDWTLTVPPANNDPNFGKITDIIVTLRYTSQGVSTNLKKKPEAGSDGH